MYDFFFFFFGKFIPQSCKNMADLPPVRPLVLLLKKVRKIMRVLPGPILSFNGRCYFSSSLSLSLSLSSHDSFCNSEVSMKRTKVA